MLKHLLPLLLIIAIAPLRAETERPALVREVNKTALVLFEKMLDRNPNFQTAYRQTFRNWLDDAEQSGDNAFAQLLVFRLACIETQTKAVPPAFFAELATHAPISPYLAAFWADALLATEDNPHLVLALLNTYADPTTPNYDIFRAKALIRLGRKLDALHAIVNVFNPNSIQSLPDPALFGLLGDICYANGLHREAALSWQRAIRAYDSLVNEPDLGLPIEDSCTLFNYSINTTRKKYRALRTLLKNE